MCIMNYFENSKTLLLHFRKRETVSLNREDNPCNEDSSNSKIFRKELSRKYFMDQNYTECLRIDTCWIPTVKEVLTLEQHKMIQTCTKWSQYNCMQQRIQLSNRMITERNSILIKEKLAVPLCHLKCISWRASQE